MIDVRFPIAEPPERLDAYLADGWFRSASTIARTPVLCADGDLQATIPVRTRLKGHSWSRSQRRTLRRNRERFELTIGPAVIDEERENLYASCKPRFSGVMAEELAGLFELDEEIELFDTREIAVRDHGRLVAVSYFDVGRRALAGLLGLYEREGDYERCSLGMYTMLEELEFGKENGFHYYYPGWILLGHGGFQYKLGLGQMQFRTGDGRWRSIDSLPESNRLCDRIRARSAALERALEQAGVGVRRWLYPFFGLNEIELFDGQAVEAPMLVECAPNGEASPRIIVEYLPDDDRYLASRVRPNHIAIEFGGTEPTAEMSSDDGCLAEPLLRVEVLAEGSRAEKIAREIAAVLER